MYQVPCTKSRLQVVQGRCSFCVEQLSMHGKNRFCCSSSACWSFTLWRCCTSITWPYRVAMLVLTSTRPLHIWVWATQCPPCWFQLHSTPAYSGSHDVSHAGSNLHSTPAYMGMGHMMSAVLVPTPLDPCIYGYRRVRRVTSRGVSNRIAKSDSF